MPIQNLNIQLRNNPLEYRSKLTIPEKINFVLELELDQVNYDKALKLSTMIFPHKQDQINFMHQYLGK